MCDHTLKARLARRSPTSVPRLVDPTAVPTSNSALTLSMTFFISYFLPLEGIRKTAYEAAFLFE